MIDKIGKTNFKKINPPPNPADTHLVAERAGYRPVLAPTKDQLNLLFFIEMIGI